MSYEPIRTQTLLDAITAETNRSGEFSHEDTIKVNDLLRPCHSLIILDEGLNVFRVAHLSAWKPNCPGSILMAQLLMSASRFCALPAVGAIMTHSFEQVKEATTTATSCYTRRHFGHGTLHVFGDVNTCPILTGTGDTLVPRVANGKNYGETEIYRKSDIDGELEPNHRR